MPGHGHFVEVCKYCNGVVMQCRCIGPKETRYGTCAECKMKIALGQPLYPLGVPDATATTHPLGQPQEVQ